MFGFGKKKKTVVATQPIQPVLFQFVPTRNFYSKRMNSHYCKGMAYSMRAGNAKLEAQIQVWLSNDPPLITILD